MPQPRTSNVDSNRQASSLNDRLNKNLLAYMATASAAGVSMLALTQSAEAKIVYTHANRAINSGSRLDLNNDGIPDFAFHSNFEICGTCNYFDVVGLRFNRLMSNAQPLVAGVSVGPESKFRGGGDEMIDHCTCSGHSAFGGPWYGIQNEYMGFQFRIKDATHFGWARFSVTAKRGLATITLTGYAYETVPLKPIITGDTGGNDESVEQQSVDQQPVEQKSSAARPELPSAGLGRLALGAIGKSTQ